MRKQAGLSFFGFVIVAIVVAAVAVTAFKAVPAWIEYFNVQKTISTLVKEEAGASPADIRASFSRHSQISDMDSVKPEDLKISQGGGVTTISVSYERVVPLVGNCSLLFTFDVSKSSGASAGQ
ncbi:DUF4845 domain-containing protein [Silvimonas amylolytica]|uniref:DUF4845 domain-containing protein n=1 Tax=Silvimonas amylolytica TaxID=449663 RepID=A0ABQ2PQ77_9NEIS|nr:DUF4845 domain-containing protein [Silvimonas amylolytica]GGP27399.1 hypothetical protein GCM10010971_32180 [Silvimonas amylolytica]